MKKKLNKGYVVFNYVHPEKEPLFIKVPIQWDASRKTWRGFLLIPDTDFELHVQGKTDEEFNRSFIEGVNRLLFICPNAMEKIELMCMPAWYWED